MGTAGWPVDVDPVGAYLMTQYLLSRREQID
jgi:hypothetical protein